MYWTSLLLVPRPYPNRATERLRDCAVLPWLSLCALVLCSYANAIGGVFQFDDFNVIVDLDTVHSLSAWAANLGQGIRPLLKLSYTLNWILGWGAAGYLGINVLIHALTTCLTYRLSQAFINGQGLSQRLPYASWIGSALFALHPANTEAVTYICGRSTSLMTLFYLAGLLAHVVPVPGTWRQKLLPPVCFCLALATKETAVTFPLALLLWDKACGKRFLDALRNAWTSWALLPLAAAGFFLTDAYLSTMERSFELNSLDGNLATQALATAYLLRQWALPLWLNIDPDLALQSGFAQVWPDCALLTLVVGAALLCWPQRPWLTFALSWVLLQLVLLYLYLPRLDVANDRQLYLEAWPLSLALVVEIQLRLQMRWANLALGAVILASALLTVLRNQDYKSEIALWEQTVRYSPGKSRVHNNLGYAYKLANRPVDARRAFLQALRLDANDTKARLNLRRLNAEQETRPTAKP